MKRREFLIGCSATLLASNAFPNFAFAKEASENKDIFVLIFLRGGCDGLGLVAPVNDRFYGDARSPELRIVDNGANQGLVLKNTLNQLDFRLHSKTPQLKELYDSEQMAIIHACGLTNGTRSHFDAMELIEKGIVTKKSMVEGWLGRYMESAALQGLLPAVASGGELPLSLLGSSQALSINKPQDYRLFGDNKLQGLLKSFYNGNTLLDKTARETLQSVQTLQSKIGKDSQNNPLPYQPKAGSNYPNEWYAENFTNALKTTAQLIKMELGLQVSTIDFGGWDTHENQHQYFPLLVDALSKGLGAFYHDLQAYTNRMTILVMSEFGRRLKANRSNGTDHGFGNVMFVLGGNIKGGKMYGQWAGLESENLDKGVDLAVTTDYRTILSEILIRRLRNAKLGYIFPEFTGYQPLGFAKGTDIQIEYQNKN